MGKLEFRTRLGELTVAVECEYPTTAALCRDYFAPPAGSPDLVLTLTESHLRRERSFLRGDEPAVNTTDPALERLALLRALGETLPRFDRVLFQGSCLAYEGRGVLFTAKSGTGKSTHTRLWRQCFGSRVEMINDDKPFLRITEAGTTAYGNPWLGKHRLGGNTQAPLAAVCLVCRGEENRLERVEPRQALPMLLSQTYAPVDPGARVRTLELVHRLSVTVPVYRLYCNMEPQAAWVARDGIFEDGCL
jgi:hypothetical protein